jgi:hypothetical protein
LEDIQELLANDPMAIRDAFYATAEFLTSSEAIWQLVESWPDEPHPYIKFQPPAKLRPARAEVVSQPVPYPVAREEVTA